MGSVAKLRMTGVTPSQPTYANIVLLN